MSVVKRRVLDAHPFISTFLPHSGERDNAEMLTFFLWRQCAKGIVSGVALITCFIPAMCLSSVLTISIASEMFQVQTYPFTLFFHLAAREIMEHVTLLSREAVRKRDIVFRSSTGTQDAHTQEAPHPAPHRGGTPAGPPRDGPEGQPARPQTHVPQAFVDARLCKTLVESHCLVLLFLCRPVAPAGRVSILQCPRGGRRPGSGGNGFYIDAVVYIS